MTRTRDIADQQKNLGGAAAPFVAGKNAVINGGMDIWQRGTSVAGTGWIAADRWFQASANITNARETTIVPTGFQYSMKGSITSGTSAPQWGQTIETANAIRFAGKTVTLSAFIATSDSSTAYLRIDYATTTDEAITGTYTVLGYSTPSATSSMPSNPQSLTLTVPSNAKTLRIYIGSGNGIASGGWCAATGVQLEAGSVATPFSRAGGTIQGELAACQRYYQVIGGTGSQYPLVGGYAAANNNQLRWPIQYIVTPRTTPTVTKNGTWALGNASGPTISMVGAAGFSLEITALGAGMAYAYPDSTDDTVTISAEL